MVAQENFADVVVVGGGLAGLVAACFAARSGRARRIVLLERAHALGGRARTDETEGYALNLGPHAVYTRGALKAALAELDVDIPAHPVGLAGSFGILDGRLEMLPTGPLSMLSTNLLPLGSKLEVARLLARIPHAAKEAPSDRSLRAWIDARALSTPATALVEALFRLSTYSGDLAAISARAALEQLAMALSAGVEYVDGGWASIVRALSAKAERLGVEILRGAPAARVARVGASFTVERKGGDHLRAGAVILAVPPEAALALLGDAADPELRDHVARRARVFAACLDVGLSRLPRPKAVFALGISAPLYVSVHTRAARLAPEGGAVVHVAKYLGGEVPDDLGAVERELEDALELLQPGARALTVVRRYRPRMTVMEGTIAPAPRGRSARPGVRLDANPGLFLAGDWIGERHLLADASAASGRDAAFRAVEHRLGAEARAA